MMVKQEVKGKVPVHHVLKQPFFKKFQKYLEKPLKYVSLSNSQEYYYGYKCEVLLYQE